MVTRWTVMSWWRSMSRMMTRMAWRWSQHTDATGSGMSMCSQGVHVACFTTDLQLILDEGIVWTRGIR